MFAKPLERTLELSNSLVDFYCIGARKLYAGSKAYQRTVGLACFGQIAFPFLFSDRLLRYSDKHQRRPQVGSQECCALLVKLACWDSLDCLFCAEVGGIYAFLQLLARSPKLLTVLDDRQSALALGGHRSIVILN